MDSPGKTIEMDLALGPNELACRNYHNAERRQNLAVGLFNGNGLMNDLPTLRLIKRYPPRHTKKKSRINFPAAKKVRGVLHEFACVAVPLPGRQSNDAAYAAHLHRFAGHEYIVFQYADVAHRDAVDFQQEVQIFRPPAKIEGVGAKDVVAPAVQLLRFGFAERVGLSDCFSHAGELCCFKRWLNRIAPPPARAL